MKNITKKTAVVALTGIVAAGMLTGCSEKKLDGTKTVATVDGTDIPLGVLSLAVRTGQASTEAMYKSLMSSTGSTSSMSIWDTDTDDGETYGEQAVEQSLENLELMYILKEKASDYDVEITDDEETAIEEAASEFMSANTDETIADLAVSEDDVKTYLELQTYSSKMRSPIIADVDTDVSDEEAQQTSFYYVSLSTSDLSDDEKAEKKETAQKIIDALNSDSDSEFNDVVQSVDDSCSGLSGHFTTNESTDEDSDEDSDDSSSSSSSSSSYPDEVLEVLRTLKDGEVGQDVIETDSAYYVVKLNKVNDEEATESQKESIISDREDELYSDTTEQWKEEADITVDKKVLKTIKVTDSHNYSIATATPTPTEAAEETASYSTDTSLEVKDGDTVNIDYVGKIDGTEFDGGSTDGNGTDLVIGSGTYIDDFEEQLIGAHPGDEVEVTVTFPDDYSATDLAGKEAVFDVTVNGIYESSDTEETTDDAETTDTEEATDVTETSAPTEAAEATETPAPTEAAE